MKVTIFLDGDSYECLLKHVGRQALSRTVIDATVQLGNTRVVDCDDVEARDLLGKARSECPGAVRRITEAMLSAGQIMIEVSLSCSGHPRQHRAAEHFSLPPELVHELRVRISSARRANLTWYCS